jgi:hypothetical protein
MDIQTRIKNSEFRKEVLSVLQSAKIHTRIEGSKFLEEIPTSQINDVYMSLICKIVQDINNALINKSPENTKLLHDIVLLGLCKSRKGKKFDDYYDEIIKDIEKNLKLSNKIFIEI